MIKVNSRDCKDISRENISIMEENKQLFLQLCQAQEEIEYWFDKYNNLKSSSVHDRSKENTSSADYKFASSFEFKDDIFFHTLEKKLSDEAATRLKFSELLKTQKWVSEILTNCSFEARLGRLLLDGVSAQGSVLGALRKLLRIWRTSLEIPSALGGNDFSKVIAEYGSGNFDAVARLLTVTASFEVRAKAYTALARYLKSKNMSKEAVFAAKLAFEEDPKPFRLKWLAFKYAEAGEFARADALLALLPEGISFSESEERERQNIISQAEQDRFALVRAGVNSLLQVGKQEFVGIKNKLAERVEAVQAICRQRDKLAESDLSYKQQIQELKKKISACEEAEKESSRQRDEQAELSRSYVQQLEVLKSQLDERDAAFEQATQQRDAQAELAHFCTQEVENLRNKLLASEIAEKEVLHQRDEQIELVRVTSSHLEEIKNRLRDSELAEKEAIAQRDRQAEVLRIMTQQNVALEEKLKSAEQRVTLTSKLSMLREADIKDLQSRYNDLVLEKNKLCVELANVRKILEDVLFLHRKHLDRAGELS